MNYIVILLLAILFVFSSLYELQMLQQKSYNAKKRYYTFVKSDICKKYRDYLLKYTFALLLLIFGKFNKFLYIFYFFVMGVMILSNYDNYRKHNDKLPLKFTKRMLRIIFLDYLLFIILAVFLYKYELSFYLGTLMLYISFHPFTLMLIVLILSPIEKMIYNGFKNKALDKLNKMNNLNIIGITGSFGKTSTKMIVDTVLKTKYKGFYTPGSFNTPNGVIMTINNEHTIFNDYFLCEMGAKNIGDIKELCDIVHPKIGILTSIGEAHLESFKNLDNVCKTKFELIESLPKDGVAILNKDDKYQREYKLKNKCNVIWIGIDKKADVMAENIKITDSKMTFDIVFTKTKKKIKVSTSLLGHSNIYNILAAAALGNHLELTDKQIINGIKDIKPISHRLELKKVGNLTILDDAFNSNPKGAKMALDTLNLIGGKKIIITPGMIEMGDKQEELNFEFGMQIAEVCDKVYLVGKKQTKPIYDGLMKKKYDKEVVISKSFKEAYNDCIKTSGNKKITILIENDLPDSYMEE